MASTNTPSCCVTRAGPPPEQPPPTPANGRLGSDLPVRFDATAKVWIRGFDGRPDRALSEALSAADLKTRAEKAIERGTTGTSATNRWRR